jgi:hypothetical protein
MQEQGSTEQAGVRQLPRGDLQESCGYQRFNPVPFGCESNAIATLFPPRGESVEDLSSGVKVMK